MFFIEPLAAYEARMVKAKPVTVALMTSSAQPSPTTNFNESYWTEILFQTLKLEGDLPMKISTLVTLAAKWGDCPTDREARKLGLFKLIGRLIQEGRFRRFSRNYVFIADQREKESPSIISGS